MPRDPVTELLRIDNPKVQRLRRLLGRRSARRDEGAFVVEGPTLAGEAVVAGWPIEAIYVPGDDSSARAAAEELAASSARHDDAASPVPVRELARGVLDRVASTESPQPLLAIIGMRPVPVGLGDVGFVVVADGVSDPGNLGTILRSAEAAGVDAVVAGTGTVDPFSPKVVRASAGALFHVPVIPASLDDVAESGLRCVGTSSHEGVAHTAADWMGRIAIVVGNETHGIPADAPVDQWVRVEHRGRAESLNVAMATTLLVFEAARHR